MQRRRDVSDELCQIFVPMKCTSIFRNLSDWDGPLADPFVRRTAFGVPNPAVAEGRRQKETGNKQLGKQETG